MPGKLPSAGRGFGSCYLHFLQVAYPWIPWEEPFCLPWDGRWSHFWTASTPTDSDHLQDNQNWTLFLPISLASFEPKKWPIRSFLTTYRLELLNETGLNHSGLTKLHLIFPAKMGIFFFFRFVVAFTAHFKPF